jgi:hypothetical protein
MDLMLLMLLVVAMFVTSPIACAFFNLQKANGL